MADSVWEAGAGSGGAAVSGVTAAGGSGAGCGVDSAGEVGAADGATAASAEVVGGSAVCGAVAMAGRIAAGGSGAFACGTSAVGSAWVAGVSGGAVADACGPTTGAFPDSPVAASDAGPVGALAGAAADAAGLSGVVGTLDFGGPEAASPSRFNGCVPRGGIDGGWVNTIGAVCSIAVGGGACGVSHWNWLASCCADCAPGRLVGWLNAPLEWYGPGCWRPPSAGDAGRWDVLPRRSSSSTTTSRNSSTWSSW